MDRHGHEGPRHPHQAQNPTQQPYDGQLNQQYPQYGIPQQWSPPQPGFPPKKSKAGWIVGISLLGVTIILFAGCTALTGAINGDGGSHAEKALAMRAAVDQVPEEGWTETSRFEKPVDPGCLSIDTDCLRLQVRWAIDHEVTFEEIASRLGQSIDTFESGGGSCMTSRDGKGSTIVCVGDGPDGRYGARVEMTRK